MEHIGEILKRTVRQDVELASEHLSSAPEYSCKICRDAGFVHPLVQGKPDYSKIVPCGCRWEELEQHRVQAMLKMCQLPDGTADWTFETFKVSPPAKEAYDVALELAEETSDVKWLTLLGDWDRGKTHLLVAICQRWLARGKQARYAYVPLLLKELKSSFDKEGEYDRMFQFFCNVPLLALDDLGVEKKTPWVMEELDTIIDYRYMRRLPLIVTTNMPLSVRSGKIEALPPRIASRLQREPWCRVVSVEADEYRLRR